MEESHVEPAMARPSTLSRSVAARQLAEELLDDIELSRLPVDGLLRKGSRLARLAELEPLGTWLEAELRGYNGSNEIHMTFMDHIGRWTKKEERVGYWVPFSDLEALIVAYEAELRSLRVPDYHHSVSSANPYQSVASGEFISPSSRAITRMSQLSETISKFATIRGRIVSTLHGYVLNYYNQRAFSGLAESVFERFKRNVDALLSQRGSSALDKFDSVAARLAEGDQEAVSQAMTTIRRLLRDVADEISPPTDGIFELGGNQLSLAADKHQNRLNMFVAQRITSSSRRNRLRRQLELLYERSSTAVHDEITPTEAHALLLSTYVYLGEILTLGDLPAAQPEPFPEQVQEEFSQPFTPA